jgi:hypothetical protein
MRRAEPWTHSLRALNPHTQTRDAFRCLLSKRRRVPPAETNGPSLARTNSLTIDDDVPLQGLAGFEGGVGRVLVALDFVPELYRCWERREEKP